MKFLEINNNKFKNLLIKNNKINKIDFIGYDDSFLFNANKQKLFKLYKYKNQNFLKNLNSYNRFKNYNNLEKSINVVFKKGLKNKIFNEFNKFNEEFYYKIKEEHQENETLDNLYNLFKEKRFYFNLDNLIPFLLNDFEFAFNIKEEKIFKNLKKLKRKPPKNSVIYIKPFKRLGFLFKNIIDSLDKVKSKFLFEKINSFFFEEILYKKTFVLEDKKKIIYKKIIKQINKKNF